MGGRHPPPHDYCPYFFFFLAAFFFFAIDVTSFRSDVMSYFRLPFLVAFFFLPPFLTAFLRFGMCGLTSLRSWTQ